MITSPLRHTQRTLHRQIQADGHSIPVLRCSLRTSSYREFRVGKSQTVTAPCHFYVDPADA